MTKITPKTKASEQNKSSSKSTPPAAAHRATNQSRRPSSTASAPDSPVLVNVRKSKKRDQLVALLVRDEGATLDQMIAATGWLPHTTRRPDRASPETSWLSASAK